MTEKNKQILKSYAEFIEHNLEEYNKLEENCLPQRSVIDAVNYSLSAGGKRIRPVLTLEFCRVCGMDYHIAKAPACAVEMVHTSSLIHDDLPSMDNDDMRRGKPSCHKAFNEATAILAGDALLVKPFEVISADEKLSADIKAKLVYELSSAFGTSGVIGGQVIDIENEKRDDVDLENLRNMYSKKTGALLKSACRMGCISAGADEMLPYADEYAECMGLAFQIIDDVLDVTSSSEELGKPVGSDEQQNKTTYVKLIGVEKAMQEAEQLTERALKALENFKDNEFLAELTEMLLSRKN